MPWTPWTLCVRCWPAALLLAACAAPPPNPPPPAPASRPGPAEIAAPGTPPAARTEADLRTRLAEAADPRPAAFALVDLLVADERLSEAVAVVEAAQQRRPAKELALLRCRLLFDLARFDVAAHELRFLIATSPEPRLRYELAEAERALGHLDACAAELEHLLTEDRATEFVQQRLEVLQQIAKEVREELRAGKRLSWSAKELLATLRGSPSVTRRLHALDTLALEGGPAATRGLQLALADAEPSVRARALRIYVQAADEPLTVVELGLADAAWIVRGTAADLALTLAPAQARGPLLEALAREQNPYVYRRLHEAALGLTHAAVRLAPEGENDPKMRAALAAAWKEAWKP